MAGEAGQGARGRGEEAQLVRGVFARVASRYDLMNDLMSGGAHRLWKDAAAFRLNPQPGETVLDIAGGTGDVAFRLAALQARAARRRRAAAESGEVIVVDPSAEMVDVGRRRRGGAGVRWVLGQAEALPIASALADGVIIGFGLRNAFDLDAALIEMRRVTKSGGRFLCLEFSRPRPGAWRRLYERASDRIVPALGARVAADREAYQYLVDSIRRFPDQEALVARIEAAGFARVTVTNFAAGVCALHQAWAP